MNVTVISDLLSEAIDTVGQMARAAQFIGRNTAKRRDRIEQLDLVEMDLCKLRIWIQKEPSADKVLEASRDLNAAIGLAKKNSNAYNELWRVRAGLLSQLEVVADSMHPSDENLKLHAAITVAIMEAK